MRHLKVYENNHIIDIKLAKKLAKLIEKHFFGELDEFDRIIIEEDDSMNESRYVFNICFDQLYKESIEQVEKINIFLDCTKDGWSFSYNEKLGIYTFFYLNIDYIHKYLDKIDTLEQSNKYNL